MTALLLIVTFVVFGWIAMIIPMSEFTLLEVTFCAVIGLTAVVIVGATMIIGKLNKLIHHDENKDEKDEKDEK